jgi:hypothetical protein
MKILILDIGRRDVSKITREADPLADPDIANMSQAELADMPFMCAGSTRQPRLGNPTKR